MLLNILINLQILCFSTKLLIFMYFLCKIYIIHCKYTFNVIIVKLTTSFKQCKISDKMSQGWDEMIVVGVSTYNESKRGYLKEVFQGISKFANKIVVVDDCSNDGSMKDCKDWMRRLKFFDYIILKNPVNMYSASESAMRNRLFNECLNVSSIGDWIFIIDSDEIIDNALYVNDLMARLSSSEFGKCYTGIRFQTFDMWTKHRYRIDGRWSSYDAYYAIKNTGNIRNAITHGSKNRFPITDNILSTTDERVKIRHMRYVDTSDRNHKYEKYMLEDCNDEKYMSLLDKDSVVLAKYDRKDEDTYGKRIANEC
jgi:glycosyltransferase involved in cell wall biosynthesis